MTSASALKSGSMEVSMGLRSTKCMRPSASGTKVQRWVASVLESSLGTGDAKEAEDLRKLLEKAI